MMSVLFNHAYRYEFFDEAKALIDPSAVPLARIATLPPQGRVLPHGRKTAFAETCPDPTERTTPAVKLTTNSLHGIVKLPSRVRRQVAEMATTTRPCGLSFTAGTHTRDSRKLLMAQVSGLWVASVPWSELFLPVS